MDINTNNIFLAINSEVYIQNLIDWLEERKNTYDKIIVTKSDNVVELIVIKDFMDIKEINKMLSDKDISPEMKKALEKRKEILTNDKVVKK